MPRVLFSELGVSDTGGLDLQERLFQELVDRKLRNRNLRQEEQSHSIIISFSASTPTYSPWVEAGMPVIYWRMNKR